MSAPIGVAGGRGGIEARTDDLFHLAAVLRRVAAVLAEVTVRVEAGVLLLLDPATGLFDPFGAAEAWTDTAAALAATGPVGVRCELLAVGIGAAVSAYLAADDLGRSPLVEALTSVVQVDVGLAVGAATYGATHDVGRAAQAVITSRPQLVDDVVLAASLGDPGAAARELGGLFPDGHAVITPARADPGADTGGPPRGIADLTRGLSRRNDDVPGAVDVRVLTTVDPDGTVHRRAVVDIPGTKDWSGRLIDPDVTNLGTNLRSLGGEITTYTAGVLAALRAAGVIPGDDVLFVGHSLGGMVAATAATAATALGYRVGGVVTAGAPAALIATPPGVPVLCLENEGDVVPHLDGGPPPAGVDRVTVTVHHQHGDVGRNHALDDSYVPGAEDVDASGDPSVVAIRDQLAPFLTADRVDTHVYVVSRAQR